MKLRKKIAAAAVAVAALAPAVPASANSGDWDQMYPTARTADCKASMWSGSFFDQPFVWLFPDQDGLYGPCLVMSCLYTNVGKTCALQIMDPAKRGNIIIAQRGQRFRSVRVCLPDRTYGVVTFGGKGEIRALGFCDV